MNIPGYIRNLLLLLSIITAQLFAQNPIPNSGFENWANGNPVGWSTTNLPGVYSTIVNTNDVYAGIGAARGQVINYMSTVIPPALTSGDTTSGPSFPISERFLAFTGFYKFAPINQDFITISVVTFDAMDNPIAAGSQFISQPASIYTQFIAPIIYGSNADAASASILISVLGAAGLPTAGTIYRLDELEFSNVTGVEPLGDVTATDNFELQQNYPNPFNPSTTIRFTTLKAASVNLTIFNQLGQAVETLVSEDLAPGHYKADWQPENLAGGVYFYRLTAGDFIQTRKLILLK